jgi:hypothetical protein
MLDFKALFFQRVRARAVGEELPLAPTLTIGTTASQYLTDTAENI